MTAHEHKHGAPKNVRIAILTISDTRTAENDEGGKLIRDAMVTAGHTVSQQAIVRDEPPDVRAFIMEAVDKGAEVVITTGGTGLSRRDTTYEAIDALLEKRLDGFGELFRMLSYQDIGSGAMLSRATAGTYKGAFVAALPGSPKAVSLGLDKLLLPQLGHIVKLLK